MKVTTKIAKNGAVNLYVDDKRAALERTAKEMTSNPAEFEIIGSQHAEPNRILGKIGTFNFNGITAKRDRYGSLTGVTVYEFANENGDTVTMERAEKLPEFVIFREVIKTVCGIPYGIAKFTAADTDAKVEDYAVTLDAQDSAVEAEIQNAGTDANETEANPDEYAISTDAFNFAVAVEIEEAEQAAYEARVIARTLADDNLAARYEKAKSQVKCERYESGWRSWFFKGKNRTEWELNATKAAACLTRYGLSICEFVILHDAEVAVIESNGFDETAFDFLPNFEDDELRDYLYDFDERQQLLEDKYEPKTAADTVTEITKAEKIAALERTIAYVMSERDEAHEELAKAEVDDEISQDAIDYIKGEINALTDEYWELVRELETLKNTPAPPEVDDYAVTVEAQDSAVDAEIQNAKFAQYLRDEAQREYEFELLAAFGKQAPEFKRYGSFKPKAAHIDATLQAKTFKPANVAESEDDDEYVPATPDTVKNSDEAWALLQKRFTGEFKFSAKFTPPDGITTATYYNREANLRLDVTSVDGEEFYFALCEIGNQPFVVAAIEVDPTLDTAEPEFKTTAPEIDEADDFTSRMAELTADLKEANVAYTEAIKLREIKRKEFNDACEAAEDAEILLCRKREAIADFGYACAIELDEKLIDRTLIFSPTMKVTNQEGGICETNFEQIGIFFLEDSCTFYLSTDRIFLGEYDTPVQVEAVISELKAAIKRGDTEFTFPTIEELSEPAHISEALAELPVIQKILAQRSLTA